MPNEHLELTADQSAVLQQKLSDIMLGLGTMAGLLKRGESVPRDLAQSALSLSDYRLAEIGKLVGVDTLSAEKIEERHAEMRKANMRIRELEAQIGASHSPAMAKMSLGVLSQRLMHWWNLEGFGHISEESYNRYGATIKFSCSLFGNFRMIDSDTPISDKERKQMWLQSLRDRGFELHQEGREIDLIDNDNNRRVLLELFAARMPSSLILSFSNHYTRGEIMEMRDIEVRIRDFEDILLLPEPPAEA